MKAWEAALKGCEETYPLHGQFRDYCGGTCAVGTIIHGSGTGWFENTCAMFPILLTTFHNPTFIFDKMDQRLWNMLSISFEAGYWSREKCAEVLRKIEEINDHNEALWASHDYNKFIAKLHEPMLEAA